MISACLHKKTRYHRRFGARGHDSHSLADSQEARRTQEDELTSCFFGTLRYLDEQGAIVVICSIAELAGIGRLKNIEWRSMKLSLWERRSGTEPDVVIRLIAPNQQVLTLLIEVKWNASEGHHQLDRQWNDWLGDDERKNAALIFLTRSPTLDITSINPTATRSASTEAQFGTTTWLQLSQLLSRLKLTNVSSATKRWCEDHHNFFRLLGLKVFQGFATNRFALVRVDETNQSCARFFQRFTGFNKFSRSGQNSPQAASPLFWSA